MKILEVRPDISSVCVLRLCLPFCVLLGACVVIPAAAVAVAVLFAKYS